MDDSPHDYPTDEELGLVPDLPRLRAMAHAEGCASAACVDLVDFLRSLLTEVAPR